MKKLLAGAVFAAVAATGAWAHTTEGDAKFGTRVLLPGHINEVAIDEMRRLVYAANFSAGRVEVVSMDTNLRIGSFPTSPQPAGTSGVAISPNGQWLVATSVPLVPPRDSSFRRPAPVRPPRPSSTASDRKRLA